MHAMQRSAIKRRALRTRGMVAVIISMLLVLIAQPSLAANDGELWILAQDTSQIKIVPERGPVERVALPAGAGPHLIEFSPSYAYAYVAGVGNGDLFIIRAADRKVVKTLDLGATGVHQAKPSPDGSVLLVAQQTTKELIKIAVNEAAKTWTVVGRLAFADTPDCTAFRADGRRAYVSLGTSGIAVVDVRNMALIKTLPTDGRVACGLVNSSDPRTIYATSNGSGGHLYRINTRNHTLTDLGYTFNAVDLHEPAFSRNENIAYISDRGGEQLFILERRSGTIKKLVLDPTPGGLNDRPDGVIVNGNIVYVALRASGKLAIIRTNQQQVTYLDLVAPSSTALPHLAFRP